MRSRQPAPFRARQHLVQRARETVIGGSDNRHAALFYCPDVD